MNFKPSQAASCGAFPAKKKQTRKLLASVREGLFVFFSSAIICTLRFAGYLIRGLARSWEPNLFSWKTPRVQWSIRRLLCCRRSHHSLTEKNPESQRASDCRAKTRCWLSNGYARKKLWILSAVAHAFLSISCSLERKRFRKTHERRFHLEGREMQKAHLWVNCLPHDQAVLRWCHQWKSRKRHFHAHQDTQLQPYRARLPSLNCFATLAWKGNCFASQLSSRHEQLRIRCPRQKEYNTTYHKVKPGNLQLSSLDKFGFDGWNKLPNLSESDFGLFCDKFLFINETHTIFHCESLRPFSWQQAVIWLRTENKFLSCKSENIGSVSKRPRQLKRFRLEPCPW